jgi:hypothetical protein
MTYWFTSYWKQNPEKKVRLQLVVAVLFFAWALAHIVMASAHVHSTAELVSAGIFVVIPALILVWAFKVKTDVAIIGTVLTSSIAFMYSYTIR